MGFSLEEIGQLLRFRENPQRARPMVRQLAQERLGDVEGTLSELESLRKELILLINLCASSEDGCPIIKGIDDQGRL